MDYISNEILDQIEMVYPFAQQIEESLQQINILMQQKSKLKHFGFGWIFLGMLFYTIPGMILYAINVQSKREAEKIDHQIEEQENMILSIRESCPPCPLKGYLCVRELEFLREQVQSGRVSTMNEALDRLDEQKHRWTLEEQNESILINQMIANEKLEETRRNTRATAVNSGLSATVDILSKL